MGIHQERTHPEPIDGCFLCKLSSIAISAAATPTSKAEAASQIEREKRLSKDLPAYKRLRDNGVQPKSTRGAAKVEALAESGLEVQMGKRFLKKDRARAEQVATEIGMKV